METIKMIINPSQVINNLMQLLIRIDLFQECAYDHIVVYDGHTTEEQIMGRFCGSKLPHPLIATENTMLLVFKSDASVQRKVRREFR